MPSREPSDNDLMARIAEQDVEAFDLLSARHEAALTRRISAMLRDDDAARDLVQEALLRLWSHAGQWDGLGSPAGWLFRIATNLALNHLRTVHRRRERPLDLPSEPDDEDAPSVPAWMIDESSPRPDEALDLAEQRRLLRSLVARLPDDKREVLELIYDADMDVRQAARTLGIPEGTVKSRLHHARRRLADEWRNAESEWEDA